MTPALQHLGYTDSQDRALLEVVRSGGESTEALLKGGASYRWSELAPPSRSVAPVPLYLQSVDDNYWYREVSDLDAVYAQFNQVRDKPGDPIEAFAGRLTDELERTGAHHLILDLRHNNGGNNSLIWPLIRTLVHFEKSSPLNRLFVVTGRNTFSACQNFLNFIERTTNPVVVGEPSSSKPNFTGEETEVVLPYTGLNMSISTRNWQDSFPGDRRRWIAPDVPVELSSADYFANRDPALEAIAEIIAAGK